MKSDNPGLSIFEYQPPALLDQAAPVQNTWYDILPPTLNVRIYDAAVEVETTGETLEVQAFVDGETIGNAGAIIAGANTDFYLHRAPQARFQADTLGASIVLTDLSFLLEGRSVQLQVRKTTAAGAGDLRGIATYGVKKN